MNAEQLRELRFMANCHNKAPLWSEFNRQAIADVLAEVASLTAERDALAAELATVREAANVEWQAEHAARLVAEERLKAAEAKALYWWNEATAPTMEPQA